MCACIEFIVLRQIRRLGILTSLPISNAFSSQKKRTWGFSGRVKGQVIQQTQYFRTLQINKPCTSGGVCAKRYLPRLWRSMPAYRVAIFCSILNPNLDLLPFHLGVPGLWRWSEVGLLKSPSPPWFPSYFVHVHIKTTPLRVKSLHLEQPVMVMLKTLALFLRASSVQIPQTSCSCSSRWLW